jgi:hypothetical protein
MKFTLEAGKKYKLRNGIVGTCVAVWTECNRLNQQATLIIAPGESCEYSLDGRYCGTLLLDHEHRGMDVVGYAPEKLRAKINLWSNGAITTACCSAQITTRAKLIETRVIEWEVPE